MSRTVSHSRRDKFIVSGNETSGGVSLHIVVVGHGAVAIFGLFH